MRRDDEQPGAFPLFHLFMKRGFSVLRFNFRGVGRSQGEFDNGMGELADAASALDWLQTHQPDASSCWVAGYSFGAWIGMQLLMRRPETDGFISVSPPTNIYDFSFLAPCPSSGLIVGAEKDEVVPLADIQKLVARLSAAEGHHGRIRAPSRAPTTSSTTRSTSSRSRSTGIVAKCLITAAGPRDRRNKEPYAAPSRRQVQAPAASAARRAGRRRES